ncbi:hypothetical protein [Nocardiopsis ganjiahuensis]|uniref:hypothetical protein n=1 Tax=Nocardiopsis ganjiahuensis TaxID=239984 RepID=UPI00034D4E35|nr:hypothetical protein [Nocardiopsis ganjiahuensis]
MQALFDNDGLLTTDEVAIAAAGLAYDEYLDTGAYICQPRRSFRDGLTHMGFYAQQANQPEVARIEAREDRVPFTYVEADRSEANGGIDARIGAVICGALDAGVLEEGEEYMVFLLSGSEVAATVVLEAPVVNNKVTASGRPWAWTMSQGYVSLAKLCMPGARRASDLERL